VPHEIGRKFLRRLLREFCRNGLALLDDDVAWVIAATAFARLSMIDTLSAA
jgi:hypothetical protein